MDPEIAEALGMEAEFDDEALESTAGGTRAGLAIWFSANPEGVEGW